MQNSLWSEALAGLRHGRREGAEHRFEIEHDRGGVGLALPAGRRGSRAVGRPQPRTVPAVETESSRRDVSRKWSRPHRRELETAQEEPI
jgi:hypothetical protein